MTFRNLGLLALAGVVAIVLADRFVAEAMSTGDRFWYYVGVRGGLLALVVICSALTANHFGWWRDYVGRAWTLFFVEYAGLLVAEVLRRFFKTQSVAYEVTLVAANLAAIGAYWLMSRSMKAAGLEYYGSAARKVVFMLLAVILAVALVHNSILTEFRNLGTADMSPGSLVSALADLITFLLVAPLLLTAFAFRGGQLFWTYAFLTTGTFGWMFNQGASTVVRWLGGSESLVRTGRITGFAIACFFTAAAALAQFLAARRGVKGALADE